VIRKLFWSVVLTVLVAVVVDSLPDVARYLKIRAM
jgi:hypothetical protein